MNQFDALLVLSFGGPEQHDDVIPFLENVLRGKNVPRERMLEVAEHYYHFDGKSPINDQNRALIAAVREELDAHGPRIPIYWGNRNWTPFLADALRQIHADGHRRIALFVTSAFGSYSGCRQYREDVLRAVEQTGLTDLVVQKLPHFGTRDEFVDIMAARVREAEQALGDGQAEELIFTAHSVPLSMSQTSPYVAQIEEASRRTALACRYEGRWRLVYQSRSGPPSQPWLEPDILDYLKERYAHGLRKAIICPIGFLSDHMEVLYDLDTEAADLCQSLGLRMARAGTAGLHPEFVRLVGKLLRESETTPVAVRCYGDCCPAPQRPQAARS